MKKILVCGAGGFIGGHLVSHLIKEGNSEIICVDIKPKNFWFQLNHNLENYSLDLKDYESAIKVSQGVNYVFNFACNMGGMGFIENNKAECMMSVLVNTNLLRAAKENNCEKYFFPQVHASMALQTKTFISGLKETDAYPADPEDGYDGKNYLVKECVDTLLRILD